MNEKDIKYPSVIHVDTSEYDREQEKKIKKIDDEHKEREREERARNDERYDDLQSLLESLESNTQMYASHLEDLKYAAEEKKKQKEEQRQLEEDKKNTVLSNVLPINSNIKKGKIFSGLELGNAIDSVQDKIYDLNKKLKPRMGDIKIEFYSPKTPKKFRLSDEENPYYYKLESIEAKNTYRFKEDSPEPEKIKYIKYLWRSKCRVDFEVLTSEETLIERKIRAEQEKLRAEQEKLRIEADKKELDDIMKVAEIRILQQASTRDADKIIAKTDESRLINPKAPSYLNPQLTPNETSQSSLFNFESSVRRLLVTILTKISNLFASTIGKILGFIIRKNDSREKKEKL
jgi:hypothetical protein